MRTISDITLLISATSRQRQIKYYIDWNYYLRKIEHQEIYDLLEKNVLLLDELLKKANQAIDKIPPLGFDHEEILHDALLELRKQIVKSNILKSLFPDGVTMPELQKTYEAILDKKFDRRNFRKKILSLDLIEDTNKSDKFEGNKPAKVYQFKKIIEDKDIF